MIRLRAPATIANLGPGFDTFGLAITLYNIFCIEPAETDAVILSPKTTATVKTDWLPSSPADNIFIKAMDRVFETVGQQRPPVAVDIEAHIPLTRGMGSSSSAVVAGLAAGNLLAGSPLDEEKLLEMAIAIEGHPDNVAPAMLGNVVMCDGEASYTFPWPAGWGIMVVIPAYHLLTSTARSVLPPNYSREDVVFNLRKASLLTWALTHADEDAFRRSLDDKIHQPYRTALIREFEPVKEIALNTTVNGQSAFGAVISGSGPTTAVFYPKAIEGELDAAIRAYMATLDGPFEIWKFEADTEGLRELLPAEQFTATHMP